MADWVASFFVWILGIAGRDGGIAGRASDLLGRDMESAGRNVNNAGKNAKTSRSKYFQWGISEI
ncbi:hypothetical protein [Planococcus sp. YIM B11945]|uniref:hypothetical protein n=1 Tax=Planococcus sp. YIM B11945 TaxID=3435410 RepID=UPI003D7D865D